MGLGLNPNDTPDLCQDEQTKQDLPVESITGSGPDRTAFVKIDLKFDRSEHVTPMTAVFAPDPTKLSGNVDLILWFHGDKHYWDNTGTNVSFSGKSIQYYLTNPKFACCKLREFILQSRKRQLILVAPTLNGHTGGNPLRWQQADAEAYLQQAVNAVRCYMSSSVTGVGRIIIAGHSGGGHLSGQMAQYFSGIFTKANEVWCFDSTYWGSNPFITWVNKGHAHARLWVYATKGTTAQNAHTIMELTTNPMRFAKISPHLKHASSKKGQAAVQAYNDVQKLNATTLTQAHAAAIAATQIDVLIYKDPNTGKQESTPNFSATYPGSTGGGHYEGMLEYFTTLVDTSRNLS